MKTKMGFCLHHESIHSSHLLVVLLVMFFVEYASAQSDTGRSPPPPAQKPLHIQTVILILVSMLLVLFFIIYMAYVKQCIDGRNSTTTATTTATAAAVVNGTDNTNPTRPRNPKGVDKSVIDTFPIIDYSAIKGLRTSKCPLECAVCLSEFENDDTLRVLPGCRHVFHPECIDTWLTDHATCPVCRSNLADPTVLAGKRTLSVNLDSEIFFGEPYVSPREETSKSTEVSRVEEIRRSHSIAEGWERYTLTLPDEVLKQIEITGRKHRRSVSVQDYTYQGKASWRDGRLWAVLRSVSTTRQRRREDQTVDMVAEGTEVSVSNSAASSRRLIGYSRRVDSEISAIGSSRLEMDLNDLPVCNRV